eukprot:7390398-Prymnesium_polylepis.1
MGPHHLPAANRSALNVHGHREEFGAMTVVMGGGMTGATVVSPTSTPKGSGTLEVQVKELQALVARQADDLNRIAARAAALVAALVAAIVGLALYGLRCAPKV